MIIRNDPQIIDQVSFGQASTPASFSDTHGLTLELGDVVFAFLSVNSDVNTIESDGDLFHQITALNIGTTNSNQVMAWIVDDVSVTDFDWTTSVYGRGSQIYVQVRDVDPLALTSATAVNTGSEISPSLGDVGIPNPLTLAFLTSDEISTAGDDLTGWTNGYTELIETNDAVGQLAAVAYLYSGSSPATTAVTGSGNECCIALAIVGSVSSSPEEDTALIRVPWTQQPPADTPLDKNHPIGSRVVFAAPMKDGADAAGNGPVWVMDDTINIAPVDYSSCGGAGKGLGFVKTGVNNNNVHHHISKLATALEGKKSVTLLSWVDMQGPNGTSDWEGFGINKAAANDTPYHRIYLARDGSNDFAYFDINNPSSTYTNNDESGSGYWETYPSGPIMYGAIKNEGISVRFYKNGEFHSEDASVFNDTKTMGFESTDSSTFFSQTSPTDSTSPQGWYGSFLLMLIIDGVLTDTEVKSLYDNPWQIFKPKLIVAPHTKVNRRVVMF